MSGKSEAMSDAAVNGNIVTDNTNEISKQPLDALNSSTPSNREIDVQILIVSGRSGSGKSSVLQILEDFGYYSIDNLPLSLVAEAAKKLIDEGGVTKVALGVDARTPRADLSNFLHTRQALIETYGIKAVKVIYVTAQESVLVARFDATRRVHPLMSSSYDAISNLPNAIKKEIELLRPISSNADIKVDTSLLNIHQLKERVREYIGVDNQIVVNLLSFGFKHGLPIDADFVFDVRILPNPHWDTKLRSSTGMDKEVAEFFAQYPEVEEMTQDIYHFLNRWLPDFLHNNRHTVTIAIGCTGGKHRSVFITEALEARLSDSLPSDLKVTARHREKARWYA